MHPGLLVVGALLAIYVVTQLMKPAEVAVGATGGVTDPNTPMGQPGTGGAYPVVPVVSATTPPISVDKIKTIRITKVTPAGKARPGGENNDWKTFQLGEVKVWANSVQLAKADFASAKYLTKAYNASSYPASNAYDGNIRTFTHTGGLGDTHTMELVLASPKVITKVEVYNRQDCCQGRLAGASVMLIGESGTVRATFPLTNQKTGQMFTV